MKRGEIYSGSMNNILQSIDRTKTLIKHKHNINNSVSYNTLKKIVNVSPTKDHHYVFNPNSKLNEIKKSNRNLTEKLVTIMNKKSNLQQITNSIDRTSSFRKMCLSRQKEIQNNIISEDNSKLKQRLNIGKSIAFKLVNMNKEPVCLKTKINIELIKKRFDQKFKTHSLYSLSKINNTYYRIKEDPNKIKQGVQKINLPKISHNKNSSSIFPQSNNIRLLTEHRIKRFGEITTKLLNK